MENTTFIINGAEAAVIFFILILAAAILSLPGMVALVRTVRKSGQNDKAHEGMPPNGAAALLRQYQLQNESKMEELRQSLWQQAQAEIDDLRRELQVEGSKRRQLEEIVVLWSGGINLLITQLRQLDIPPIWEPPDETLAWVQNYNRDRLSHAAETRAIALMDRHFDMEELLLLARDLQIDPDNLAGSTKLYRIRSLIDTARRHNKTNSLCDRLRQLRPSVTWPTLTE